MKLNPLSTHQRISKHEVIHETETSRQDRYFYCITDCHYGDQPCNDNCVNILRKPNPPTPEAIKRAHYKDKTYHWNRDGSIRSGNKRSSK